MEYQLEGLTLATQNTQKMRDFYREVFGVQFQSIDLYGTTLYRGTWLGLALELCPAEVAKNTASQNRHQFNIRVKDLDRVLEKTHAWGGSQMGEINQGTEGREVGVYDPDRNSIVLKEMLPLPSKPRATGLGGIFFKCQNPEALKQWYQERLGLPFGKYGLSFEWGKPFGKGYTACSPFAADSDYFAPGQQEFMINLRVQNLEALLEKLRSQNVRIIGEVQRFEYGNFAWILDLEGRKVELWEAKDEAYEKILDEAHLISS